MSLKSLDFYFMCAILALCIYFSNAFSISNYLQLRNNLIRNEELLAFGGSLKLEGDEIAANRCLMAAKLKEVDEAFENPKKFLPAENFRDVREQIERSEVFKIIHKMPKGALFHAHSTAIASLEFMIKNITYLPNVYLCRAHGKMRFRFFQVPSNDCNWELLENLRKTDSDIDNEIRKYLNKLREQEESEDGLDVIWEKFEEIFSTVKGLLMFRPVFEKYFYQAMQELYDDNIMYAEFRCSFSTLYEINGTQHDPLSTVEIYKSIIKQFISDHPDFLGAKIIYSPFRLINREGFDGYVRTFRKLRAAYPDFIVGFDLVGQEDKGHPLLNFAEKLQELSQETQFFFHAGETNWYGHSTDENLVDAVLLNTKRIGHGYALLKHPKLMEIVKQKHIAIELNPISNQVLKLVKDMRNHPASYFFAENFPVVVSNDDPSLWGATGLSYDFYEAFVGIMSRRADLRALKQLAINSIVYSSMSPEEQIRAFNIWTAAWEKFVKDLASRQDCVYNHNLNYV